MAELLQRVHNVHHAALQVDSARSSRRGCSAYRTTRMQCVLNKNCCGEVGDTCWQSNRATRQCLARTSKICGGGEADLSRTAV
jgi:hypothetical protein